MTSTERAELYRRSDVQALANDAVEAQLTRKRPLGAVHRLLPLREPMTPVSCVVAREIGRYREAEDGAFQAYVARTADQAAKDFSAIVSASR